MDMDRNKRGSLIEKLYQTQNIMMCELKISRNYGTAHKLTYSDICLLKCVQHNEGARASDLSQYLGITNGAVAQLAKKLDKKGYLEPYRIAGNRKEVYYKLTDTGEAACRGYDGHYGKLKSDLKEYIRGLDEDTTEKIIGMLDLIIKDTAVNENCSIAQIVGQAGHSQGTTLKRCEKCQRIY